MNRWRYCSFVALSVVLLLVVIIAMLEVSVPRIFGKWWPSINLVGNPDHRMTPQQYEDVNSDGVRSARQPEQFSAADYNIVMLGDSFVYGMLLGRQDTLPYRLEQLAHAHGHDKVNVINFGWVSASPYLSLRQLKDIGQKYKPDLVVQVVDMTDPWDDTFYRRAVERSGFFALGHWLPATSLLLGKLGHDIVRADWYSQALWGLPWQRYFPMERPLAETRPYLETVMHNLDATNTYVRQRWGVPYVVFIMPRSVQYSATETPDDHSDEYARLGPYSLEPFRFYEEAGRHRPYPVISLLDDFRDSPVTGLTFPHDPHLSSAGNKEAARFVWAHLQDRGLPASP